MPQTVLAIDDSLEIHQLLDVRLKPEQLSILHAIEAEEGLRMARELQPDLVLLDMNLDGRSGLEVCHLLKNNPETVNIPVIFLTGESDLSMKIRGFDAGAIDYVVKPFEPAELRARVRAALRTKRFQDLLATRAQVDALTGLRNRAYFDQRILEEMEAARRYARLASLVLVDIDHFKHVNDTFGHPVGDQVLQSVGETLASAVRTSDAVCRFGGEEFAVILREVGGAAALIVAERMRSALATCAFAPGTIQASTTAVTTRLPTVFVRRKCAQ